MWGGAVSFNDGCSSSVATHYFAYFLDQGVPPDAETATIDILTDTERILRVWFNQPNAGVYEFQCFTSSGWGLSFPSSVFAISSIASVNSVPDNPLSWSKAAALFIA